MPRMLSYEQLYLDWFNNYLTVKRFADDYGFSETRAKRILAVGKRKHEQKHKESQNNA